ncbi:WG repeat-containing protein [Campylobacter coli]|uniref:WG repeat-containing protein n=1 Tax=Campylobacter coli TaxID=195 RepID=UPI00351DA7A3
MGLIDKSGKFVIKPKFDSIWSFREGLAKVGLNGKYGLIDKSGKIVIEPKFDDIRY